MGEQPLCGQDPTIWIERIFMAIADKLEWRARFKRTEHILHYLDDFLIMALAGSPQCSAGFV